VAQTESREGSYSIDSKFLEHHIKAEHDPQAALVLLEVAAEQLASGAPLTDDVREYLLRAIQVVLAACMAPREGDTDPGKQVLEALGLKVHHRRRKVDRDAVGREVAEAIASGASKNQRQAVRAAAQKFRVSQTTAWECHREFLALEEAFKRLREHESEMHLEEQTPTQG